MPESNQMFGKSSGDTPLDLIRLHGTWLRLLLNARWSRPDPNRPARPILFNRVFCFLILLVSNDFCFCLRSCDGKFSAFDHFPCILKCCVSLFFFLVCVCGGGNLFIELNAIQWMIFMNDSIIILYNWLSLYFISISVMIFIINTLKSIRMSLFFFLFSSLIKVIYLFKLGVNQKQLQLSRYNKNTPWRVFLLSFFSYFSHSWAN